MRVPPAQSSTDGRAARQRLVRDRAARSARVTLVSRVPNRNTETRLRASVMACRKCRNRRVYSLIEPEISSSATIGAGFSIRPSRWMSMMSPPVRRMPRKRAAHVEPQAARIRPVAAGAQSRPAAAASARWRGSLRAISAALICAKSFFCSISLSETDRRSSCSWACGVSRHRRLRHGLLHAARGRRRLLLGVIRQRHRIQHVLPLLGGAEEQVEGLREDQRMLVALDEDRLQRGEDVGAVADVDHLQRVHGIDDRARPDRNARPPAARGQSRRCCRPSGRSGVRDD